MLILLIMLINYDKVSLNLNFNCGENTDKYFDIMFFLYQQPKNSLKDFFY
ncbi:MAG: hypothetical protein RLZZ540_2303 [Bacteroidota bacterium]|jgi:hypothetical protein